MKRISDCKRVIVFLSMLPSDGGKFQYSLSILHSLASFNVDELAITAAYLDKTWEQYVPSHMDGIQVVNPNLINRIVRRIILLLPFGLVMWRVLGKYVDPIHKCLYDLKPDLIIFPGNDSLAYRINLPSCIPIFDLMHRYELDFPEVADKAIFNERERHYRRVCKYAKAILVDSKVGKQHVLESYKVREDKIYILPYTAPPYVRDAYSDLDIVSKYGLPERFIFYPAQFWSHKNHIGLLKAISLLKDKGTLINAVFVGSSKNADINIKNAVREFRIDDQIFILPYVNNNELLSLYKKAVALVMPSFLGPTNIPPLEAFALGCPVLTSNVYAIPEQIGDAALLFDPRDTNDIADKIECVWIDNRVRDSLSEKGYKMDTLYSSSVFGQKLAEIMRSVLGIPLGTTRL